MLVVPGAPVLTQFPGEWCAVRHDLPWLHDRKSVHVSNAKCASIEAHFGQTLPGDEPFNACPLPVDAVAWPLDCHIWVIAAEDVDKFHESAPDPLKHLAMLLDLLIR